MDQNLEKRREKIPSHWEVKKLEQLLIYVIGGDWGKDETYDNEDYDFALCIRGTEIKHWNESRGQTAALRKIKKSNLVKRKLQLNDIILEISGGGPEQPVGRTVVIDNSVLSFKPEIPKICTNFFRLIRPSHEVIAAYLNNFLTYFYKTGEITKFQAGSNNLRNLKFPDYIQIPIPLPPLAEQQTIVAKIEELFSELEKGKEQLETALAQLKVYRQSLLQAAFSGKLTSDWRSRQGKMLLSQEFISEIIKAREIDYSEKVRRWSENSTNSHSEKLTKPKKPSNLESKNDIIEGLVDNKNIPVEWTIVPLAFVSDNKPNSIVDGPFGSSINVTEDYIGKGIPVIRMINIRPHKFCSDQLKFIKESKFESLKRHNILPGDVLLAKVGATIGDCCIYPDSQPEGMLSTTGSCRIRVDKSLINVKFLEYYISNQKNSLKDIASQTAQPFLNMKIVKSFPVVLPILAEQQAIVEILESKLTVCDKIEETIKESIAQAEVLRQSILKQAFDGKLVKPILQKDQKQ